MTFRSSGLLGILTSLGGPEALSAVRGAVQDQNPDVRASAIRSLSNWSTPDSASDLLAIARSPRSPSEKMVALRGYFGFAQSEQQPEAQRLAMCRDAAGLLDKPEEKRLLLSALGSMNSSEAVGVILPYVEDSSVRDEAASAVTGIAERALKGNDAAKIAGALVQPLKKVAESGASSALVEKANALLRQATEKSGAK